MFDVLYARLAAFVSSPLERVLWQRYFERVLSQYGTELLADLRGGIFSALAFARWRTPWHACARGSWLNRLTSRYKILWHTLYLRLLAPPWWLAGILLVLRSNRVFIFVWHCCLARRLLVSCCCPDAGQMGSWGDLQCPAGERLDALRVQAVEQVCRGLAELTAAGNLGFAPSALLAGSSAWLE